MLRTLTSEHTSPHVCAEWWGRGKACDLTSKLPKDLMRWPAGELQAWDGIQQHTRTLPSLWGELTALQTMIQIARLLENQFAMKMICQFNQLIHVIAHEGFLPFGTNYWRVKYYQEVILWVRLHGGTGSYRSRTCWRLLARTALCTFSKAQLPLLKGPRAAPPFSQDTLSQGDGQLSAPQLSFYIPLWNTVHHNRFDFCCLFVIIFYFCLHELILQITLNVTSDACKFCR